MMGSRSSSAASFLTIFLVTLATFSTFTSAYDEIPSLEHDRDLDSSGVSSRRDPKLFPFLAYVTFGQGLCSSADNTTTGVCVKSGSKCTALGGTASGTCAQGYGSCCLINATCAADPVTVNSNGTRLIRGTTFNTLCRYEIPKQKGVCQVRLDFTNFYIQQGDRTQLFGECNQDTLTISGSSNPGVGTLCGDLTGQHMYLNYGTNDRISVDIYQVLNANQSWTILVTMIKCNSPDLAPQGCLQYYTAQRADVQSFNYQGGVGSQLNNQDYSVCIRANSGMRSITWSGCSTITNNRTFTISDDSGLDYFPIYDPPTLGAYSGDNCTTDFVAIYGANRYCGTWLNSTVISTTQPFLLQVHFDAQELILPATGDELVCYQNTCDYQNSGFCLTYAQSPN